MSVLTALLFLLFPERVLFFCVLHVAVLIILQDANSCTFDVVSVINLDENPKFDLA